jgi:type VI secretion system protein VasD
LLAPLALLAGCSSASGGPATSAPPPGCEPPQLEIFLQADALVNLAETGQPMPVEVRALLLRDRAVFDTLDFETVWQRSQEVLDKQLVASTSLTVYPGKLKIYPLKSTPEVAYVALVAIFRKPEANGWKYVVDVRQPNRRCASTDDLHTVVHAALRGNRIGRPE